MSEHEDFYTPEHIDEQVDALIQKRDIPVLDQRMARILRSALANEDTQEDARSLEKVLHQLMENGDPTHRRNNPSIPSSNLAQRQKQGKLTFMKKTHEKSQKTRSVIRIFSTLAAMLVITVLIASMLIITRMAQQNQGSPTVSQNTTAATQQTLLPQGIYTSSKDSVFRLDAQTHQVLWQQSLQDVTKIIPSGNSIYILQSSQSGKGTNAVLELNASTGKTLWSHVFRLQPQDKNVVAAQLTDMALVQSQLYVGLQTWIGSSSITGKIYVLNASSGNQQTVYSNASVWSLAADDGILAVSGNYSLQVYDPTNGKSLWHVSLPGGSSEPVISLKIVNHLVYAAISTNNEESGEGLSYIAAYQATTGQQIWKSPTFPGDALSHFTVDQNVVYFGTLVMNARQQPFTGSVYAYDVQNNKKLWSTPVNGGAQEPLVSSEGVVYTVADNGSDKHAHLVALNAATGTIEWQQTLIESFLNSLCVSNSVLYVGSFSPARNSSTTEQIEAFNANNGLQLWESTQDGSSTIVPTA